MDLTNIYISPLELCNLHCQSCYTKKPKNILTNDQILDFIDRYQDHLKKIRSHVFSATLSLATDSQERKKHDENLQLKSIILCGGEVFTLPDFPALVNALLKKGIFITIITNGTIDRLTEIADPHNCQLLVSFDGPESVHDQNRGLGNFQKSKAFVRHAIDLGFPVGIMYLITAASYPFKDSFDLFGLSKTYLTDRLHSLTPAQIIDIKKHYPTFPPKDFHCSQLSVQSDGFIYGCCESPLPLAKMTDPVDSIISKFIDTVTHSPHGCCAPNYLCGYPQELGAGDCHQVVQLFN